MPDFTFEPGKIEVVPFTALPTLAFELRIKNQVPNERIHSISLRCQIQIEATRRRYSPDEQKRLQDLFGEPERWSQTLRTLLWTHTHCVIPAFEAETNLDVHVPCSFDFNVAATKYFYGLERGEIPLCFQFSGSAFHEGADGGLLVAPISWDKEARFRLPVEIWRKMMDVYYPNGAWLRLRRDTFDRLYQYKVQHGFLSWEDAFERMLEAPEVVRR